MNVERHDKKTEPTGLPLPKGEIVPFWMRGATLRKLLRALHRDAGYLAIGLTLIYAISGIAVNHIADWDPNYQNIEQVTPLPDGLGLVFSPDDASQNEASARKVLLALQIEEKPSSVYAASTTELDIMLASSDVHVDLSKASIVQTGQKERFLLKTANFLHLNRGKRAWSYIADSYATLLLMLAISGLFMVKGRRGVWGRGGIFVLIGAAVPIVYVVMSNH